ncbi:metallophosphoesterase [Methylomicrobium sp. Wu6]|uniref:metallophosphoesterase n=1 Tax=Methylomicrobium sp. Wu6 TaxID=3107928 RepID=UPI002DD68D9A|nr:metallophosphoesterase [Methylomicrobium sp. Wu6]MEC4747531.1 metallophosphoesterase [Methylomicrobium sp. Wu6]
MQNHAPIRKLPANVQGKDYVVGDLHGCYRLLERLLDAVHFDKSRDRLFSVGDLIDRGPESLRCLQLLAEPWFYAVLGNHEIMMLDFFLSYLRSGSIDALTDNQGTGFLDYGGNWVKDYFQADQCTMSDEFNRGMAMILELPLIWVVGDGKNRFHVIHAELVKPNYRSDKHIVWLDSDLDCWLEEQTVPPKVEDRLLWGRTLMLSQRVAMDYAKIQPGLSRTFCGHTYAARPRQVLSHLCLDTGAFISEDPDFYNEVDEEYGLTIFDVKMECWVSASYQSEELVWGEHAGHAAGR